MYQLNINTIDQVFEREPRRPIDPLEKIPVMSPKEVPAHAQALGEGVTPTQLTPKPQRPTHEQSRTYAQTVALQTLSSRVLVWAIQSDPRYQQKNQ